MCQVGRETIKMDISHFREFKKTILSLCLIVLLSYKLTSQFDKIVIEKHKRNPNFNLNEFRTVLEHTIHSAYDIYSINAYPDDIYDPLNAQSLNLFDNDISFMLTAIESLDTLYLNNQMDKIEAVKNNLGNLQFNYDIYVPASALQKILSGLLGIYVLDKSPVFLNKATELSNLILPLLMKNNRPSVDYNFYKRQTTQLSSLSAYIPFQVEFMLLSQLTNDNKYEKAITAMRNTLKPTTYDEYLKTNKHPITFQNHIDLNVLAYTKMMVASYKLTGNQSDLKLILSTLLKIQSKYLCTTSNGDIFINTETCAIIDESTCDMGGVFIQMAQYSKIYEKSFIKTSEVLVTTCYKLYTMQKTQLAPRKVNSETFVPMNQYQQNSLSPKIVESLYHLRYYTHNPIYLDMAYSILLNINMYCHTGNGYSGLTNVNQPELGHKGILDPKFIAKTLKYLVLMANNNYYVLNSFGHVLQMK